jgi:hypothetical protein
MTPDGPTIAVDTGFDDRPDKEIERLQDIVRVAVDEISERTARVMTVANGVNFVNVVGHEFTL